MTQPAPESNPREQTARQQAQQRARQKAQQRTAQTVHNALSPKRKRILPIPLRLVVALAALVAGGTLLLLLPGMTTQPISFMDALFTATSAAAVTGLTVVPTSMTFTRAGQWVILLLMQFGGLGLLVTVVLTLRLLGLHISLVDRQAVSSSLGLASTRAILQVLGRTVTLMLIVEGIGALVLALDWVRLGLLPPGEAVFYGLFHAVAAFCNAGFDLFSGQPQHPNGLPADGLTMFTLGVLVIVGGLGIPVYMELLQRGQAWRRGQRRGRWSLNTRLVLWSALVLLLVGWLGLLISEYRHGGVLTGLPWGERVLRAWFQSAAARTAGFAGFGDFGSLDEAGRLLLICLMFVGSAPASMGGGITTGTLAVLMLAMWSLVRGYDRVRAGNRTVPAAMVWRAVVILLISLGLVMVATWLLLLTQKLDFSTTLFEVVSAYSTTGLSLGATGQVDTFGRLVLIVLMFWGRLGAITIMLVLLQRRQGPGLTAFPEETVLVG